MAEAVLEYLKENPAAMDTLEGIAEWWIGRAQVRADVARLARVLEELESRGVLEKIGRGAASRYRLRAPLSPER